MTVYFYNENEKIVHIKNTGLCFLTDMINFFEYIENAANLPKNLKILEDSVKAEISLTIRDIEILVNKISELSQHYNSIKHAAVITNRKGVAYSIILSEKLNKNKYFIKAFSTKTTAKRWLQL